MQETNYSHQPPTTILNKSSSKAISIPLPKHKIALTRDTYFNPEQPTIENDPKKIAYANRLITINYYFN